MKKLLVTGYSGFVGKHLLSRYKTLENINLLGRGKFPKANDCLFADIDSTSNYSSILEGVDVVIHIAAITNVMDNSLDESLSIYREVNTAGTINLAKQAAEAGSKRFIFISSIKVNGESTQTGVPFRSTDKRQPKDFYGQSKSEAEELLMKLARETSLEVVIIRPPLIYGADVKANFASLFNLVSKKIFLPFGSINNNRRSLVSVYNLVDLIHNCIDHPKAGNQIFLVSDDQDLSTTDMVKLMAKVQGNKPRLLPVPVWILKLLGKLIGKPDMISRLTESLQVDITHTKEVMDWKPPHSVEQGFTKCVQNKNN
tara:strand:- start:2797 stop:3735 length:939 start_codon:yes stop_codon:yes gene_type:complete